jgi:Recombination endonuclease VII
MNYQELTPSDKASIKSCQNYVCAICFGTFMAQELVIDHDHSTGEVRKAICIRCNIGLGQFEDDHNTMLRAACYVIVHKAGLSDLRIGYKLLFNEMNRWWRDRKDIIDRKADECLKQAQSALADEDLLIVEPVDPETSTPSGSVL